MTPTEAQRLSEQARYREHLLATAPRSELVAEIRSLARQLAEAERENGRLRGLLDGEGPQVSMGTAAGILRREVESREEIEYLADRYREALERYENEAPDWLKPIARAALNPPDPPAPPPKDPEGDADVEGAAT